MARHFCVILHGIEYDPSEVSWVEDFYIDSAHLTEVELFPEIYGYVKGWHIYLNSTYRERIVNQEVDALFRLQSRLLEWDTQAKFSVLAHSLGATIVQEALEQGFMFHNIILMMGAFDECFLWVLHQNQFNNVFVYWSPNDEEIGWSRWGKQGLVGSLTTHPRVFDRKTTWTHNEFMDRWYMDREPDSFHERLLREIAND